MNKKLFIIVAMVIVVSSCSHKQTPKTGTAILTRSFADSRGFVPKSSGYIMVSDGLNGWYWVKLKR